MDFSKVNLNGLDNSFFRKNKDTYLSNLINKLNNLETNGLILIQGGKEIPRYDTDSVFYHFIQESNFYYLTGVVEPNFFAYIDLSNSKITLFMQMPDERTKTFQNVPTLEDVEKKYGMKCHDLNDIYKVISKRNPRKIYLLSGINSDSKHKIPTASFDPPKEFIYLRTIVDTNSLIYEILADTRSVKSQEEIKLIKYSVDQTALLHLNLYKKVSPGLNERELENFFKQQARNMFYCRENPFLPLFASGLKTSDLVYSSNNNIIKEGLIIMETGIRLAGYCSDLTSTIPINGVFTEKQKNIYQLVLNVSREIIKIISPYTSWLNIHLYAERLILKGLRQLGLLNSEYSIEEMAEKRVSSYFFPHGIGHFIGLERHDVGGYLSFLPERPKEFVLSTLRTVRNVKPGNVLTLEPAIYFNSYALDKAFSNNEIVKYLNKSKINEYKEVGGVRIEEVILITEEGSVCLSSNIPREVKEIEEIMKK